MKLEHGLVLVFVATIGIYATFLFISDFDIISEKISDFKFDFLPIILLLTSASWIPIFFKWHILLKNAQVEISFKKSIAVFLSGPVFEVTPGQIGILMKAQILKTGSDISRTKTIPIVLVEKLYDLIGAILASIIGIIILGLEPNLIIIAISALIVIFFFMYYKPASGIFFKRITKTKFFSKYIDNIEEFYETVQKSTRLKVNVICILLSLSYWFIISAAAYVTLIAFDIDVLNYLEITAIYSTSVLLGAVTFIPAGIGITEGSVAGLFTLNGINISTAFIVSIMIRILTLWYSVSVGFIALKFTGIFSFKKN